jgi:hypothetical protein
MQRTPTPTRGCFAMAMVHGWLAWGAWQGERKPQQDTDWLFMGY